MAGMAYKIITKINTSCFHNPNNCLASQVMNPSYSSLVKVTVGHESFNPSDLSYTM